MSDLAQITVLCDHDGCEAEEGPFESEEEAREATADLGWKNVGEADWCPDHADMHPSAGDHTDVNPDAETLFDT